MCWRNTALLTNEQDQIVVSHPSQQTTPNGSEIIIRPVTLKLLKKLLDKQRDVDQKLLEKTLQDTGIGKNFLNRILVAWEIEPTIEKLDLMIKSSVQQRKLVVN